MQKRMVAVRQVDGLLRHARPSERDQALQAYYPEEGRFFHPPAFFEEQALEV